MKKYRYVGLLLAVVMSVFVFSGTAFAVPDENTQWLMELIDRSVDPAEKAELETLLEDIQSGEARWIEVQPENKIRTQRRDSIRRYSDPITKPGYTVGTFQLKLGFTDAGAYIGVADYWHTKAASVTVLTMKRRGFAEYPANQAVRAVEEYHLEAAQIRDFIETDTFYY